MPNSLGFVWMYTMLQAQWVFVYFSQDGNTSTHAPSSASLALLPQIITSFVVGWSWK